MPHFKIITNQNEINLSKSWVGSPNFKSRIVNQSGRQYKLIAKKERSFSGIERAGRGFLGVLAVCCSIGFALFSKTIRNLFAKNKETVRFGIVYNPPQNLQTDKKIKSLIIGAFCSESMPCQHPDCTVTYSDGQVEKIGFNGAALKKLIAELPKENVTNLCGEDHFSHQKYAQL